MVPFAGWEMPVQYEGVIPEHLAVRKDCGAFDVSHMGEIEVKGPDAIKFVNRITSNDVTKLIDGQAQYSALTTPQGTVIDDLLVYRLSSAHLLLVVNASTTEKDWEWILSQQAGEYVALENVSTDYCQIALQGPSALGILQTLTETLSVYYIRERLLALLSGYFGLFALLLGAIGVYGVTAHAVNRRRMEIGIRMAIGATAPAVVRLVVGRVAVLAALGVLLGFVLSLWGSRLIQALLFNTEFRDPSVLATSIVALLLVTALAAWRPARRASRIEPATVLREG